MQPEQTSPFGKVCLTPANKMKKILALITFAGFGMAASAQTPLYEWNFTDTTTTTLTSSVPSYAWVPGTGNLFMKNGQGTTAIGVNAYFTNGAGVGPGTGPGGSAQGVLKLTGQGYNGAGVAATTLATNLNIGSQLKFTVAFWFHFGAAVGTANGGGGSFPRIVMLAAGTGYDSGSANTGVGVGASVNNWTLANGPDDGVNFAQQIQNGNGNNSGAIPPGNLGNHFTLPEETGALSNGIVASDFGVVNNTNWYFEAMTFDGTLASGQFKTWLGTSTTNVVLVDSQNAAANMLPIANFGTNAVLFLANRNGGTRPLAEGEIADLRIYSGVVASNNLEAIRTFQIPILETNGATFPVVQLQPASGKTHPGLSRSFNVIATGQTPLSYQWKTNNVSVPNATNSTFTVSNVSLALDGTIVSVRVTNVYAPTNSIDATLTVLQPDSYASAVIAQNPFVLWHVNETTNGNANASDPVRIFDYASSLDGMAVDPLNIIFNVNSLAAPLYPGFFDTNIAIQARANGNFSRLNMAALPRYTNDMTICGWIRVTNTPTSHALIYSMNGGNQGPNTFGWGYGLVFGNATTDVNGNPTSELSYNWSIDSFNPATYISGLAVPVDEWTFVALTIDPAGTNATLYMGSHSTGLQVSVDDTNSTLDIINGTANATAPILLARSPYSFYEQGQGSANGGNNVAFNDVVIFYKALSASTITNLYLTGAALYVAGAPDPSFPGNLLLNYPLGNLQSADQVQGPYTDVLDGGSLPVVSPYSVPMTNAASFFRAKY
jgi:Concanavalin A-like lectin/glucanases superfamily